MKTKSFDTLYMNYRQSTNDHRRRVLMAQMQYKQQQAREFMEEHRMHYSDFPNWLKAILILSGMVITAYLAANFYKI